MIEATRTRMRVAVALLGVLALTGCSDDSSGTGGSGASGSGSGGDGGEAVGGGGGGGGEECVVDTTYNPMIDAANFVADIDNPLSPMMPGMKWVYEGGGETIEVEVLAEKKMILGISCTVVHDVAKIGDEIIEDTLDWFAQDMDGTVWYMGEDTKELRGGMVVSTEGSWEAGKDGAKPGVIMPGNPMVGDEYRQEYYACEAEDFGEILTLDETVDVPAGMYAGCLKTKDTTPLEPNVEEEKYYCPGVGVALIVDIPTGNREELITFTP